MVGKSVATAATIAPTMKWLYVVDMAITPSADEHCILVNYYGLVKVSMSIYDYENNLRHQNYLAIAGIDEVGRGAWAGPLIAGAVILEKKLYRLRDSKMLTAKKRQQLATYIIKNSPYGIGIVEVDEINLNGLTWANWQAMIRAIKELPVQPDHLLIDYITLPKFLTKIPQTAITDGDKLSASIAAASIIAKVHRDKIMNELHYNNLDLRPFAFNRNAGYGTALHRQALKELGATKHHRQYYLPVAQSRQITFDLS